MTDALTPPEPTLREQMRMLVASSDDSHAKIEAATDGILSALSGRLAERSGEVEVQAETYREMHRIATDELGYPSILEALEAVAERDALKHELALKRELSERTEQYRCSHEAGEREIARLRAERDALRAALVKARNSLAGLGYPKVAADICDLALTGDA